MTKEGANISAASFVIQAFDIEWTFVTRHQALTNHGRKSAGIPHAGAEPQLAAGERCHGGALAGHAVERIGARRRSGGLPAVHLGRLGAAASGGGRAIHSGGAAASARA